MQTPDLEVHEYGVVDVARALELERQIDWAALASTRAALEAAGDEHCPPGLGLERPDGATLHVYLEDEGGRFAAMVQASEPRRLLGFIPSTRAVTWSPVGLPAAEVAPLIRFFLESDTAALLDRIRAGG